MKEEEVKKDSNSVAVNEAKPYDLHSSSYGAPQKSVSFHYFYTALIYRIGKAGDVWGKPLSKVDARRLTKKREDGRIHHSKESKRNTYTKRMAKDKELAQIGNRFRERKEPGSNQLGRYHHPQVDIQWLTLMWIYSTVVKFK